jgi:hypothetical protein
MISKAAIMSLKLAEMNGDCSRRDQTPCKKINSLPKNPIPSKNYAKFSGKWKWKQALYLPPTKSPSMTAVIKDAMLTLTLIQYG